MRKVVKVENKVVLFLYFIVLIVSYRIFFNLFGLFRGFVCICICKVVVVVLRKFRLKYMLIVKGDEFVYVIVNYKEKWGFFMCVGVIDGIYILILIL